MDPVVHPELEYILLGHVYCFNQKPQWLATDFLFRVSIQYDQLIMFENFYEYINDKYENLKLTLRITPVVLVWCCVDPRYSLLHDVTTSFLETVNIVVGINENTKSVALEVPILKQCADNISIKSVNNVYTKRFTQLNSYGRTCTNVIPGGNSTVEILTNNLVGFCFCDHTDVTLTCSNWEITTAEIVVAGYNINEGILTTLKSKVKKRLGYSS
jgi:hypothetical protein